MTQEELLQEMEQEAFVQKILQDVERLNEKANRKDYQPSQKERDMFGKIYTIITNMNNWF